MAQSQQKKNTISDDHPLMKSPIGISFKHLSNTKALNHAFMQHDFHQAHKASQQMAGGGQQAPQQSQAPRPMQQQPNRAQPNRVNYPNSGPIAVNPKTGERLRHEGGKWVPMQ